MADDRPADDAGRAAALADLSQKLDTVAGALAAIAASHTDLLSHVAEAEARRSHDAHEVTQRLEAIERQLLAVPASPAVPPPPGAPTPDAAPATDLEPLRADITLSLDVLARVAESVERLDSRTEDRLAAVRDAAVAPVADLQALLSARNERHDAQMSELAAAVGDLAEHGPAPVREQLAEIAESVRALGARSGHDGDGAVLEHVDEVAGAVKALSWKLPELAEELAAVREQVDGLGLPGSLEAVSSELEGRLTLHIDTALAGALRLIDDRLAALRRVLLDGDRPSSQANVGGFEAGAVMGAAQAAWNRLEQRLDHEFDDLGRQLQAMAVLIEQAVASTEAVANRPVVTGDQLRRAASAVKDTVVGAGRSRRERRGGPRGLGSG